MSLRRKSKSADDAEAVAEAPVEEAAAPEPVAAAEVADEMSVEDNAAAAFAAAGEPPPVAAAADPPPPLGHGGPPPPEWGDSLSASGEPLTERPEALVGAAFAGGVVAALILKRLVR